MLTPISYLRDNVWNRDVPEPLWLLTPGELEQLPDGTVLTNIFGETKTYRTDVIDTTTRFGYIPYGLLDSEITKPEGE